MSNKNHLAGGLIAGALFLVLAPVSYADGLTFEERVRAQEAIERVYYSHQIGATKPFEQAVPREVLERKVRLYLEQSAALEGYWQTPVTADGLLRELERMTAGTRLPERLGDLYAVLDHDPLLIQECLARPALVNRLNLRRWSAGTQVIRITHQVPVGIELAGGTPIDVRRLPRRGFGALVIVVKDAVPVAVSLRRWWRLLDRLEAGGDLSRLGR